ncbi:MAG: leucine--tRNA ligase [Calditrichaceae bacterium]
MGIPYKNIEKKWKKYWQDNHTYKVDLSKTDKKCYSLVMFSYPSSDKLHLGHWFNYGPTDSWARFKRMQGYNVFEPMGFDAFGLPAENYAVKTGIHPQITTEENVSFIREQLKAIGAMYDWDYEINTSHPDYYKWTQWLFLKLYEKGLAYRSKAPVNWCPKDQTVLANEQVVDGSCERCGTLVEKRNLTQWFFKITDYADELLEKLDELDWPEKTKAMQNNWIGKSYGLQINFGVDGPSGEQIKVFTTRPDTLFGVTYVVLAPEHELVDQLTINEYRHSVDEYKLEASRTTEIDRVATTREKTGVFTGSYAVNPVNGEKVPVWVADYVLATYGTGAVMAVPGHDTRDFEFAKKYDLPIRKVILEEGKDSREELIEAFVDNGIMINSGKYDNLSSADCVQKIGDDLSVDKKAQWTIQYKLRDWLVSRQRYWGAPIPIIHCDACGEVPVPESDLPVILPEDVDFNPKGQSPLSTSESFVNTTCPKCGAPAKREVDTMDTFVCSSWYYLRYPDPVNSKEPWNKELINKVLPVDKYVGGAEHATMHLLYSRFITKALRDMGYLSFDEPFLSLVHQGVIKGPDGMRMSKSKGNVVNPEIYLEKYGGDVFRMYLMFGFAYTDGGPWDDSGITAIDRFIKRVWRFMETAESFFQATGNDTIFDAPEISLRRVMHNSIKGVTQDTERFHFNTSVSRIMELTNELYKYVQDRDSGNYNRELLQEAKTNLILLLAPFTPHLAEELWEQAGGKSSVFDQKWPEFEDEFLKVDEISWVIQVNGKIRERLQASADLTRDEAQKMALTHGRIPEWIDGKTIKKVIVVPKKLINIVVTG